MFAAGLRRTLAYLLVAWLAAASAGAGPVATPADRFGPLFEAVQMRRLFADSKTFADAVPKRAPAAIMRDYRAGSFDDAGLRRFVDANFAVPEDAAPPTVATGLPLDRHIAALWSTLTRAPVAVPATGSLLSLPGPYVVPGGRFREIYYWDSYFTMLGLVRDGRADLVESMIDDFTDLIERYGHVPNGTRTYYLSRSQPPFFALMVSLSASSDPLVGARRLRAMQREYAFWMHSATRLRAGTARQRVVAMPDGSVLNRYFDDRATPRDEAWREDVLVASAGTRPPSAVYRDLRAAAESGWDFSSRWLQDGRTLATIRTTAIVPVDLNSLLYGVERTIAAKCQEVGDRRCVAAYRGAAQRRRAAISRYLWNGRAGRFADYDWPGHRQTDHVSAAMLYPLFTGVATPAQARLSARLVARLLVAPGGLRTTLTATGQQWDRPNGWAPLQWVAVSGLRRYGETALACSISRNWLENVRREYASSGRLLEKYNVEARVAGGGGEYPLQDGFGWTNGVTRELLASGPNAQRACELGTEGLAAAVWQR